MNLTTSIYDNSTSGLQENTALSSVTWLQSTDVITGKSFQTLTRATENESLTLLHDVTTVGSLIYGDGVPVSWVGDPFFYIMHITAIASCGASCISSFGIILFLFMDEKRAKGRRFYKWTTGERLVVYLAAADLFFSISHGADHAYIMATVKRPHDVICKLYAFLIIGFVMGQGLIVLYTALSACLLVIWQKKVYLGRYDWRLLLYALGIPFTFCTFGVVYDYIGFSGPWCVAAVGNKLGIIMDNVKAAILSLVFFVSALCYTCIWCKMKSSGPAAESAEDRERKKKYHRSAKVMMLFVIVYIVQWWSLITNAVWTIWAPPPKEFITALVFMVNFGGVYNALAYTVMRRKYLSADKKKKTDSNPSVDTCSSKI